MSELFINPARTCSFTGHRAFSKSFDGSELKEKIIKLIDDGGYDTFLVGMAIGFDTFVFNLLEDIRRDRNIRIIACIPCVSQAEKFNPSQKIEYERMVKSADERVYISEEYTSTCMQKRNEYMVDSSSCIICYVRRNFGGSYKTQSYAMKKGIAVISV